MCRDKSHDVVGGDGGSRHDERLGNFTGFFIGHGNDGRVGNGRVRDQQRFEFGGGDLQPLVFDELFHAIDDGKPTAVVHHRDITGAEPAIVAQAGGGGLGLVEVALHDLRPVNPELTALTNRHVVAGERIDQTADRVGQRGADRRGHRRLALHGMRVRDRAGLGEAVALSHATSQPLLHRHRELTAQGRGAAEDRLQRAQIIVCDHRVLGERQHDGRHHIHIRDAMILQRFEKQFKFELGQGHDGGSLHQRAAQNDHHAVDVKEGQDADDGIVGGQHGHRRMHLTQIRHQIAMRQHHALRDARRAAGVRQHAHIGGRVDRHLRRRIAVREQFGVRHSRRVFAEHHDLTHGAR